MHPTADPPAPTHRIRLADLPAGASARLLDTGLDADTRGLLRALGLTDACTIRICKRGDPCIIQVRDTRIGLSRVVASGIYVTAGSAGISGQGQ